MGQLTIKMDETTIKKMKTYYANSLDKSPQGAIFRARTEAAVITAYRSGKVLFQGSHVNAEANKWQTGKSLSTASAPSQKRTTQQHTSYRPPNSLFTSNHIGSDESGTGDYFGPVTTAAVYVTSEQISHLKALGIQDSKAINDQTVQKLAKEIATLNIPYSLMILHNEKYNQIQAQGWSQGKMKAMLHHSAINRLLDKIGEAPYDGILIDQFCQPNVYMNYLKSENEQVAPKTYFMTKAESYSIAVAAGSVIARASFLQEMEKLSNEIGFDLLKGASVKVDKLIAQIIRTKGKQSLNSVAKLHFKNTEKAREYM